MTVATAPAPATGIGPAGPPKSPRARAEALLRQMEQVRDPKMSRWRDLELYVAPYSANVSGMLPRQDVAIEVLDETIFYCRDTLRSFFAGAMTNPAQRWSAWTLPDPTVRESEGAKEWLHTLNERRFTLLSQSNFYEIMNWAYGEWSVFATAVVLIEEDEDDVFRYVPWEIGSYAIADDAKGQPCALSRRFKMTLRQIVERFAMRPDGSVDEAVLSEHLRAQVRAGGWESEHEIAHLICPNPDHRPGARVGRAMAFSSYYWEWGRAEDVSGKGGFLAHEGYHEWPAMVFRWARLAGDPWGTNSPGYQTLGAVKSAQAMESDHLMMIEKAVKPPLVTPTALTNVNLLPGAHNKVDLRSGMMAGPLHQTDATAIEQARMSQDRVAERIYALWYTRLILASNSRDSLMSASGGSTQPRTAEEIRQISAERFQILGPVVEAAAPAFRLGSDREFAIMLRRGFVPEAPPEIEGMPLAIEYTSALGLAQKSVGLSAIIDYAMTTAQIAKMTGDSAVLIRTDWSELAQAIGDRSGLPPNVQRTDEEVAEILEAQAAAAQKQAQAEQLALEARATKDLSSAQMGEDTALDRVVQAGGVPGAPAGAVP